MKKLMEKELGHNLPALFFTVMVILTYKFASTEAAIFVALFLIITLLIRIGDKLKCQ